MLKKILIIVCCVIFGVGILMAFNRKPDIDIGEVWAEDSEKSVEPYELYIRTRYEDSYEKNESAEGFSEIISRMPYLTQTVSKSEESGKELDGDIKVNIQGDFSEEVYYTVLNENGKVLQEESTRLKVPTGNDIDSCVIRVRVLWGKEKNYKEYEYYFGVDIKYV